MAKKKVQIQIRLDNMRTSFCKVFEAERVKAKDKPAFSCHFIFQDNPEELKKLKQTLIKVANAKWGKEAGNRVLKQLMKHDRLCFKDGNDKLDGDEKVMEGYADNKFISARSYVRPTCLDRDKTPLTDEDGKVVSGCYVNAYLSIWAQSGQYGKRINAQLQGLQFVKSGGSFGGGKAADPGVFESLADEFGEDGMADEDYDDFAGNLDDDTSLIGPDDLDDDIPF